MQYITINLPNALLDISSYLLVGEAVESRPNADNPSRVAAPGACVHCSLSLTVMRATALAMPPCERFVASCHPRYCWPFSHVCQYRVVVRLSLQVVLTALAATALT